MKFLILLSTFIISINSLIITEKSKRFDAWDYQNDIVRGVNLGGWFVLEPYIKPSLFGTWLFPQNTPVDEYHFTKQLGKTAALQVLKQHWASWYTEADFEQMSYLGLNVVRIPIGYWAFQLLDNDPYVQGQVEYLDKALQWSRNHNIKVWIDLHGAPGSQNGFDNSGLRDTLDWQKGNNVQITLNVLQKIFEKYGSSNYQDVVIGIELLNEPLGPALNLDQIKDFYNKGYSNLRQTGSSTPVIIHDAFQPAGYWDNTLQVSQGAWSVVVDHHHYQVFSPGELERDINDHVSVACNWGWDAKKESHWSIVGEWSAALTDCATWLNGVGRGARYEGQYDNSPWIGSCSDINIEDIRNWPSDYKTNVRKYIEAQLDAFEFNGGWIFWNWKTETAGEWDFQKLTAAGLFPQPLNNRQFPNQCGFH
ncbi:exgA [Candida pseudojiufengensis]|uniref:exgA n=1 Tax=Candida pseudojiufengensis TaxID=497109 RepID=UPI0022255D79|nr:exgA [Candida pseudojiufengensis]KAI5966487.1 exgA [Candida pseudojiufengensis]